jgi:hypothetical protein
METGFRFSETMIFQKRIFGFGFRPAGGAWRGMQGGSFWGFFVGGQTKKLKNGKIKLSSTSQ